MKNKNFVILSVATLVIVIASVIAVNQESKTLSNDQAGKTVIPGLQNKLNDVTQVEITRGKNKVSIKLDNGQWVLEEKDNYPATSAKVKQVLIRLAELTTIEAKTKKESNYKKLGVEDPTDDLAGSTLVTVKSGDATELASIIIGKQRPGSIDNVGQESLYVRKANTEQAWLARGEINVEPLATDWLDDSLMDIDAERIMSVSIKQADGTSLSIIKKQPGDKEFFVADIAKGKKPNNSTITSISRVLQGSTHRDVHLRSAKDGEFFAAPGVQSIFSTFDGMVVTAHLVDIENTRYAKFDVTFNANLRSQAEAVSTDKGKTPAPTEDNANKIPALKDLVATQQEVSNLQNKLKDWIYKIPTAKAETMMKKLDDILEDESTAPATETKPISPHQPKLP